MRYFKKVEDNPEADNYEEAVAVFRFDPHGDPPAADRWDGEKWVWRPHMIAFTGIGGDNSFHEIAESEVNEIMQMVTQRGDANVETGSETETDEAEGEPTEELEDEQPIEVVDEEEDEEDLK